MTQTAAAVAYRRNAILTASPGKIIKLLYDGALRNLERSRIELSLDTTRRSAVAGECLGKAFSIVSELRNALDLEAGGEVAQRLDACYDYSQWEITNANVSREAAHVEHAAHVLSTLKEAWDVVLDG